MRHKWLNQPYPVCDITINREDGVSPVKIIQLSAVKKCVRCGLKKGVLKKHYRSYTTVYFQDGELGAIFLKEGALPFKCDDMHFEFEITEEEMML